MATQRWKENNQAAGTTTVWDYDAAGNITRRRVYPYTTGSVSDLPADALIEEVNYVYNDSQWGDLLKAYNGRPITYDAIGNPTNDFTWRYTWQHGRQLASMTRVGQSETWHFTYNADGLRTQKTNGTRTYQYTYLGDQLSQMTVDGHTLYFAYDTNGSPISLTYDGTNYYYVTNLQGDILALLDTTGTEVVRYAYDAWGNLLTVTGSHADTIGYYNPLRYRAYVYDEETGLYYLQSRYYNPEIGRFINADGLVSTGQGILGNNMYAYCLNNSICYKDVDGTRPIDSLSVSSESADERERAFALQNKMALDRSKASASSNDKSIIETILEVTTTPGSNGSTCSFGYTAGSNWGGAGGGVSGNISVDNSYNYALQHSTVLSASSVGMGTSVGIGLTITNAPSVQDLSGVANLYGGTLCGGAGGISIDVIKFTSQSDPSTTRWGISVYYVVGASAEIHWGESYTTSTQSWNPLKKLKDFLFGD